MRLHLPLDAAAFLRRYWQKEPLVVRRAFPGFTDPLTPEGLAGLAGEAATESRLVLQRPWRVRHGPHPRERFRRLPATRWTLLVHGVDLQVDAVADLRDAFDFVPRWRLDDVMVSYAAPQGSVGPHVDGYDVFLVQGRGQRRWAVQREPPTALVPDLPLRILSTFRPDEEWTLEPGDMLYVPPGVAHWGVADVPCLTYSVGFRAPSAYEAVLGSLEWVANTVDRDRLYADPDLVPPRHPAEVSAADVDRLRRLVHHELGRLSGPAFARVAGRLLTDPRRHPPRARRRALSPGEVEARLCRAGRLVRRPGCRIAFVGQPDGAVELCADGRGWTLPPALAPVAPLLAGPREVALADLRAHRRRRGFWPLLADLVNAGAFTL